MKEAEPAMPTLDDGQKEASEGYEDGAESIPSRPKPVAEAVGLKGTRKGFKIGGKSKASVSDVEMEQQPSLRKAVDEEASAKRRPAQSSRPVPTRSAQERVSEEEELEETAEEKAERKRRELKRKNEETARKLAQMKRKKRF